MERPGAGATQAAGGVRPGSDGARLDALEAEVAALRDVVASAGTILAGGGQPRLGADGRSTGTAGAKDLPFTNAARKGIRTTLQVATAAVPGFAIAHLGLGAGAAPYLTLLLTPLVAVGQNAIEDNVLGRAFLRNVAPTGGASRKLAARADGRARRT